MANSKRQVCRKARHFPPQTTCGNGKNGIIAEDSGSWYFLKMTKTYRLLAIITLFLFTLLACGRTAVTPSSAPGLAAGELKRTLSHDGQERSYILYVPAVVDWSQPVPLVFVFHGGGGSAQSAMRMSGFNAVADEHGFLVVYPNGTGPLSGERLLTWNAGGCCANAQENNVDDVGFVRAVLADVQASASIDARRIYTTGMSNGAMLSHRLACEASDVFAAAAPVAGTLNFPACQPAQPIAMLAFHGTDDQHAPYEGGAGPDSLVGVDFASVEDSMAFWAAANGCQPPAQTRSAGDDFRHEEWPGCRDGTAVELVTIFGGGHAWPGGAAGRPQADQPTQAVSASQLMWEFFAAHPKQTAE